MSYPDPNANPNYENPIYTQPSSSNTSSTTATSTAFMAAPHQSGAALYYHHPYHHYHPQQQIVSSPAGAVQPWLPSQPYDIMASFNTDQHGAAPSLVETPITAGYGVLPGGYQYLQASSPTSPGSSTSGHGSFHGTVGHDQSYAIASAANMDHGYGDHYIWKSTGQDLHGVETQRPQHNVSVLDRTLESIGRSSTSGTISSTEETCTPRPRWSPTQEQIQILESLFNSGTTTPSRDMIVEIAAQLRKYGNIAEANVFYWFQNRKARAKRKLKPTPSHSSDNS